MLYNNVMETKRKNRKPRKYGSDLAILKEKERDSYKRRTPIADWHIDGA